QNPAIPNRRARQVIHLREERPNRLDTAPQRDGFMRGRWDHLGRVAPIRAAPIASRAPFDGRRLTPHGRRWYTAAEAMPSIPPRGQQIIQTLYETNRGLAIGTVEQQRLLTRLMAEQFAFEFGPQWGCKAAGPGRPPGPSELAFNAPPLYIWRWSDGDGHVTGVPGAPLPEPLLEPLEQTAGQLFLPVDPIDHLQMTDTRPPRRSDPPASVDLGPILDRLATLERIVTGLSTQLPLVAGDAHEALHRPYPRYVAKLWGTI